MISRLFSINAWCFAIGPPTVGKWDRFTSYGPKVKDGEESLFNDENLGQMVDNFANRKNDLAMCYDHQSAYVAENGQPAPALAWYNALALVVDGKVLNFATHDPSVVELDPTGLENGVYGYRSEVTPLGEKLLPNYRFVSPMFTDQGADEEGNQIGYDILDVAATNTPFQDGVGLTFHKGVITMASSKCPVCKQREETNSDGAFKGHLGKDGQNCKGSGKNAPYIDYGKTTGSKGPQTKEYALDPEMMKRLGLAEGCSDAEAKGAMTSQLAKYYAAEDAEKMADEPEEEKKDEPKKDDAEKMADEPDADDKKKMAKEDDEEKDDMKAMAKSLGLDGVISPRAIRYAVEAKMTQAREAVAMRAELEKLRAEQSTTREQALTLEAERFADEAIKDGQWAEEKRDGLIKLHKRDAEDAKAVLFKKGEFTHVRKNYSKSLATREQHTEVREKKGPTTMGADFGSKAKAYAKEHGVDLRAAQVEVAKQFPDLYQSYKSGE